MRWRETRNCDELSKLQVSFSTQPVNQYADGGIPWQEQKVESQQYQASFRAWGCSGFQVSQRFDEPQLAEKLRRATRASACLDCPSPERAFRRFDTAHHKDLE